MASRASLARAARLKQVREATGLTQLQFLPRLNAASRQVLGEGVREYSQSTLSKLETAAQESVFEDVEVYAAVDPQSRGKLWLAWGEDADSSLAEPKAGPSVIRKPTAAHVGREAPGKQPRPAKKEA